LALLRIEKKDEKEDKVERKWIWRYFNLPYSSFRLRQSI